MQNEALQRAKGVRDFGPAEKIARDKLIQTLRSVFELYGYNPIETPVMERYELFASKYGIGQESDAMRETFKLKDQGLRDLVLRTEFTVPFARFVGMNPQLKMPFKRYQIGKVFRDGPIKLGRYREFYQCDVDVVGVSNPAVDAELVKLINTVFSKLNLEVVIKTNNRNVLNAILSKCGVPEESQISAIISIDKFDKIGDVGVKAELLDKKINAETADEILKTLALTGSNIEKIQSLKDLLGEIDGLKDLEKTINLVGADNLEFIPNLARGLAYYTGNVFEVFLKDTSQLSSSICAGGRFDNMIGGFIGTDEKYPAVGVSFGLDTIFDALQIQNKGILSKQSVAEIYVLPVSKENFAPAFQLVEKLRAKGIAADIDFLERKVGKNMEYANSYGMPWVIVLGDDEVKQEKYTLKNMTTGEQVSCSFEEICTKVK
ncbi:MAG: Histidine-tRNA ligase [Parcubacteria group bacterium GW2011_GWA2_40_23]|nr:MAG: Histidine-tRNA ligase [Parcubacteria group bacterium GW2011_GWA2_40_23]